jgi:hypothetical protein
VHGVITQSGFNMDLTKKPVASAQNYEEIKEEAND